MIKQITRCVAVALILVSGASCSVFQSKKDEGVYKERKALSEEQTEILLAEVGELQELVDSGKQGASTQCAAQLERDFPDIVELDLGMYLEAEMYLLKDKQLRAAKTFENMIEEYPDSELKATTQQRLFDIGKTYLRGKKKVVLGFIRIAGHGEGVEILNRITDDIGLDDPNQLGLKSALAVAHSFEARKEHEEAYLKWLEISITWQRGELGKQALLGMAGNKHAAYTIHPEERQPLFDAANLKTAKTYYQKFVVTFPDEAKSLNIDRIILEIEQQMARKELSIGQFYQRTGQEQAANIYFNMVVETWPDTNAAQIARESVKQEAK
jgi:outer membrane protein assembly factor BamD (BamD/ComL family)